MYKNAFLKILYFFLFIFTKAFGQQIPATPEVFLPEVISTGLNERDFAISPDGKMIYFTVVAPQNVTSSIFFIEKLADKSWSIPKTASFSGDYPDLEPSFSPDGGRIYFASKRPVDGNEKKDFDLWYVERYNDGWSAAKHLDFCTEQDEFYPSVTKDGSVYFTASYHHETSKEDIFVSRYTNNIYVKPMALDTAINSSMYEFNAYIAPDESFIIFTAYGRKGDKGRGDLYLSKRVDGKWQPAKPINQINSDKLDYCPTVSFDQKILYFTSERTSMKFNEPYKKLNYNDFINYQYSFGNGLGDIYWVSFDEILLGSVWNKD
jgi:Tol biopolymer transport system component